MRHNRVQHGNHGFDSSCEWPEYTKSSHNANVAGFSGLSVNKLCTSFLLLTHAILIANMPKNDNQFYHTHIQRKRQKKERKTMKICQPNSSLISPSKCGFKWHSTANRRQYCKSCVFRDLAIHLRNKQKVHTHTHLFCGF